METQMFVRRLLPQDLGFLSVGGCYHICPAKTRKRAVILPEGNTIRVNGEKKTHMGHGLLPFGNSGKGRELDMGALLGYNTENDN